MGGTGTVADYGLDELREAWCSVMLGGLNNEREDGSHVLACYVGFVRVIDTGRDAIKSAIRRSSSVSRTA